MKAAAWTRDHRLVIEDRPEPSPAPGEVLVRVTACGICGSDLHQYHGTTPARPGLVPGHEIAGIVAAGDGLPAGTPVAVEPLLSCGSCPACREGNAPVCRSRILLGVARDGGLQEYLCVPGPRAFALPPGLDPALGSLAEPLAVCVRGTNLAAIPQGARVLVLGAGTIGLLTTLVLRSAAREIAVTARYDHQAAMAARMGAATVLPADGRAVGAWAAATPPDVVIETVGGTGETLTEAINVVRPGGTVVTLGVFGGAPAIAATRLVIEEITLRGSLMYGYTGGRSEFATAVSRLAEFAADLEHLQTHRFRLLDCAAAFETAADKGSTAVKVTVLV